MGRGKVFARSSKLKSSYFLKDSCHCRSGRLPWDHNWNTQNTVWDVWVSSN